MPVSKSNRMPNRACKGALCFRLIGGACVVSIAIVAVVVIRMFNAAGALQDSRTCPLRQLGGGVDPGMSAPALDSSLSTQGGEAHSLAVSSLVDLTRSRTDLSPTDIQTLLAFISAPKPGDLTDGEWEERVNGILNLLRRQTEESFKCASFKF